MHAADAALRREIALFRYGLIAALAHLPPGTPGIGAQLRAKAEQHYTIPGTLRTRVAAETLRDWLHHYRAGGFDALYPKPRADRGQPRRLPPEAAELLLAIKTEHPTWSVRQVIQQANSGGQLPAGVRLAHSTVHRLLRAEGLMSKPGAAAPATSSPSSTTPPPVSLRRLRPRREYRRLPARVQASADPPRPAATAVRRQRRQLSLPTTGADLRQARHRPDPRPALSATGQGQDRTLLPHLARPVARLPHTFRQRQPRPSSTAACGPTSKANITTAPIAAWAATPRSSSGR